MRILFDGYWWVEGPVSNRSVQRAFIATWRRQFPVDETTVVVPAGAGQAARTELGSQVQVIETRWRPHGLAASFAMGRLARKVGADVVLTHNFAPVSHRSAVFIHDVLFKTNPEWFTRPERAYFSLIPRLAPRADLVLTSSATEAARIRHFVPRARRVEAVGLAVPERLLTAAPRRPAQLDEVGDFVLTVGRLNVRKNLATALTAALESGVVDEGRPAIVVGYADGRGEPLPPPVHAAVRHGVIRTLDAVDDAELAWLYQHASLLVFLSLDEGYGLPPIEALHFGCPVVVSDIQVFHETLGDRATFVPPLDAKAAGEAIAEALQAPRRDGLDHQHDTWETIVSRIRDALLSL